MTKKNDDRMFEAGSHCAMAALREHRALLESLPDRERMHFWCGFLTAGMGGAMASLGEPAMRAVREALLESAESRPESGERPRRRTYLKR